MDKITEKELLRKWVYMGTMNYAIEELVRNTRELIYPPKDYDTYKYEDWKEMQRKVIEHVLKNWDAPTWQGQGTGHTNYAVGHNYAITGKTIVGRYKEIEIEIKWEEVKSFIEKMFDAPRIEERQIDLLELLAMEVS